MSRPNDNHENAQEMRSERSDVRWLKKGRICQSHWFYKIPTMITEEIYKQIENFEFIEVSNLWNVRSKWWHFIITECKGRPYLRIKAQKEILSPMLHISIHIAVADLFLWRKEEIERRKRENIRGAVLVCHIDDDPQNNRVDNLYLWDPKSNAQDLKRNKLLKNAIQ